jgi:hypothetical protein
MRPRRPQLALSHANLQIERADPREDRLREAAAPAPCGNLVSGRELITRFFRARSLAALPSHRRANFGGQFG